MALDLPDDGQAVDGVAATGTVDRSHIFNLFFFQPLLFHLRIFFLLFLVFRHLPFPLFFAFGVLSG